MIIGIVGPHAVGKTTAVRRWVAKYPKMLGVLADVQLEIQRDLNDNLVETRVREWKGTTQQKGQLIREQRKLGVLTIIDTARAAQMLEHFGAEDPVIIVSCSWSMMRQNLIARCEANNKKFAADYWTQSKLRYEAEDRYINYARKNLRPSQFKLFRISTYDDWQQIDSHFTSLYIKNQRLSRS